MLQQSNIFTGISHSVPRVGHAWQGACMAGGCAWQRCHVWQGEHAWQVVCVVGGMHGRRGMHSSGVYVAGGACMTRGQW